MLQAAITLLLDDGRMRIEAYDETRMVMITHQPVCESFSVQVVSYDTFIKAVELERKRRDAN